MLELMESLPEGIVGVVASGQVTAHDYETVLVPAVDAAIRAHGQVRVLYRTAPDFEGFTLGAMWDDARMGLAHLHRWERVAIVTDVHWIRGAADMFRFMMPCPVRVFAGDALGDACAWIGA